MCPRYPWDASPKSRHYRDDRSRDFAIVLGFDFWRRLSRKLDLQLSKQEQQILLRLCITGQDDHPIFRSSAKWNVSDVTRDHHS
jgi:hypothetical protein